VSSGVIITIVVIGAIIWLSVLGVSALRSRGSEEIPSNLAPGESDEIMETKRLERAQQAAVLLSAFLAVGIPLYYLGEPARQDSFVEEYAESSIARGIAHWEEFQCASCHGADGGGGVAAYVEKRTGVAVNWVAPAVNDVFLRYSRDEVRYWLVFGRANSPMPAWGLEGGGPMTDAQIEELLDYMESDKFRLDQNQVVSQVEPQISGALAGLAGAEASLQGQILDQRQLIADIERAADLEPIFADISERARALVPLLGDGLDTDGDGVADAREVEVNQLTAEARQALLLPGVEEVTLDPENPSTTGIPDLEKAEEIVATYRDLADTGRAPVLGAFADTIQAILDGPAVEEGGEGDGEVPVDTDGDGLNDAAEAQISAQTTLAVDAVVGGFTPTNLDPASVETVSGVPDLEAATTALAAQENLYTNIRLNATNAESLLSDARTSLDILNQALVDRNWEFDFEAIAEASFGGDVERATRVVGIYEAYCARCHTSGWSAGVGLSQPAGSGGFGPALYEGRPAVQFLSDEDLKDFLIVGAVPNQPYGINGMGSGRMPAFGAVLAEDDLLDLSTWLRNGDLQGRGDS
jgi:mono/diheme cytochrome c family protein